MGIRTKFQPMGYQINDKHSMFRQIEVSYQHGYTGYLFLDNENCLWISGTLFTGSFRFYNVSTPIRFLRGVKKICKQIGNEVNQTYAHILYIGTDDKLYHYGAGTSYTGSSTSYSTDAVPIAMLENVKDAWAYAQKVNNNDEITFYALTKSGVLYACGYNGANEFGNGTTTNSNTWVQVLDGVSDFKVVPTSGILGGTPVLVAVKNGHIMIANYSASTSIGSISGSSTYYEFTQIQMLQNELTSEVEPTELLDVLPPYQANYIYTDTSTDPITNTTITKKTLGIVGGNSVIYGEIGFGFHTIYDHTAGFEDVVSISPIISYDFTKGFVWSTPTSIKYFVSSSASGLYSTSGSTQTIVSNTQIKKFYGRSTSGLTSYLTKDNDLYMAASNDGTFFKREENVDLYTAKNNHYLLVTKDNKVYRGLKGVGHTPEYVEITGFSTSNTSWQN